MRERSVAVIGGGIAGLSCARRLQELGVASVVYDTGKRAPGGRASSRLWRGAVVDHAVQYAGASTAEFADVLRGLEEEGRLRRWGDDRIGALECGAFTPSAASPHPPRYIGGVGSTEGMATFAAWASVGLDVRQDVWVPPNGGLRRSHGAWLVGGGSRATTSPVPYTDVVIAHNGKCAERITSRTPARNVHALLRARFARKLRSGALGGGRMTLCSVYSLLFEAPADAMPRHFDGATVEGSDRIRWLSNNAAKCAARQHPACAMADDAFVTSPPRVH